MGGFFDLICNRVGSVFKEIAKTENGFMVIDTCKISTVP